jgi:hypothetical protein
MNTKSLVLYFKRKYQSSIGSLPNAERRTPNATYANALFPIGIS